MPIAKRLIAVCDYPVVVSCRFLFEPIELINYLWYLKY